MGLRSTFWRAALKWPRIQRLEFLDLPELGARYLNIPKTGSGSIRMQAYRQLEAASDGLPKSTLWDHTVWVRKRDVFDLPERFTFAFSRDPYERVASLYRHKILAPVAAGQRVSRLFVVYGRRIRLGMPFDEFVAALGSIPDERAEKHFRSQSWFLFQDALPVADFVGRMERFEQDWGVICERTGFEPMRRAYNQTTRIGVPWTEDLRAIVRKRYAEDFAQLGYEG